MTLAVAGALLAGVLTVLAPCSLSLLPVVVGGAVQEARARRAVIVALSLGASVAAFTLLLRASTALIDVPTRFWQVASGVLLIALGVFALLPELWDRISVRTGLQSGAAERLHSAAGRQGVSGAVLTGIALGPVFTSCSPVYGYVVVTVLPAEPARGLVLLGAYVVGLVAVLLAIALLGQRLVRRLRWAADPHSLWRRAIGALLIVVGLLVATGAMLALETWVLENSPIQPWEIGSDIGR